ncbi:unnamed protein product [Ectocarpus sp. 4 AP-2014]
MVRPTCCLRPLLPQLPFAFVVRKPLLRIRLRVSPLLHFSCVLSLFPLPSKLVLDRSYRSVQVLAEHADKIVDLRGVGQDTARQLLEEIMGRQKLTYPLAKVFMNCGDDELSSAIASLNLWDAIPAGRQGRHTRHL